MVRKTSPLTSHFHEWKVWFVSVYTIIYPSYLLSMSTQGQGWRCRAIRDAFLQTSGCNQLASKHFSNEVACEWRLCSYHPKQLYAISFHHLHHHIVVFFMPFILSSVFCLCAWSLPALRMTCCLLLDSRGSFCRRGPWPPPSLAPVSKLNPCHW